MNESIIARNVKRIGHSTQITEREYRNPVLPPRNAVAWQIQGARLAVATSSIASGSVASPGHGTMTLYIFDPNAGTSAADVTGQDVYNTNSIAIPSGAQLQVHWIDGAWFVDVASCPA